MSSSALGPTLETARLILRPPTADDMEPYLAFMADEATARFLGGVQRPGVAWRGLATIIGAWVLKGYSMFSVIERASGRWVGRVGPWHPYDWPGTEVGWGIVADAQGRGYAQEAATAALDWAFDTLGWTEVIHCIEPANAPSLGVARALGSTLVRAGVSAPPPLQTVIWDLYGQTREAWKARRRRP